MSLRTTLPRFLLSAGFAFFVTAALLLVMQHFVHNEDVALGEGATPIPLDWIRIPPDDTVRVKEPKPTKPPPPDPIPPDQLAKLKFTEDGHFPVFALPPPVVDAPTLRDGSGSSGALLPILTAPPDYPIRARERGLEGFVLVEFTISRTGTVVDPKVVQAEPANIFERSAINAIKRYKYRPRIMNGSPVPVSGVMHRIVFEMEGT